VTATFKTEYNTILNYIKIIDNDCSAVIMIRLPDCNGAGSAVVGSMGGGGGGLSPSYSAAQVRFHCTRLQGGGDARWTPLSGRGANI